MNIAVRTGAVVAAPSIALGEVVTGNDAQLLALEDRIWDLYDLAHEHDDEMIRLHNICAAYLIALGEQRPELSGQERWKVVTSTPESKEHTRLVSLTDPYHEQMGELVQEMWKIPACTAEGRRAKFEVLLACCMGQGWERNDKDADWDVMMARQLLLEYVGGQQAAELKQQFTV